MRQLWCPAQAAQEAVEILWVICNGKLALDHLTDAGQCPLLCREAGGQRAASQLPQESALLLPAQLAGAATGEARCQPPQAACASALGPLAHGCSADAEARGNLRL